MLDLDMVMLTTGESLDEDGNPIPGTGFEYESDGHVAELLAQRTSPLLYSPAQGEWAWVIPSGSNKEIERVVAVCPTGNKGPQYHYHPIFDEHFKVASGSFVLKVDGEDVTITEGQDILAKKGTNHTFRAVGEEGTFGVIIADVIPAVGFEGVMKFLFGQSQEGKVNSRGDVKLLQVCVWLRGYRTSLGVRAKDIAIPVPPGKIIITILSGILAPLGRLLGYKSDYPHYYEDEFWEKRVNQPSK
jgi:mannose-6-phosphate isomerase-like protein (cupin superfamily)